MGKIKELICEFKEEDYFDRVNLHIHSRFSDGTMSPGEITEKALYEGLQYISITDHNSIEAYKHIDFNNLCGLNLIPGVEFDCWHKTDFMHILGYGIDVNNPDIQRLCAKNSSETKLDIIRIFSSRKSPDVIKAIKNANGIAVLAHPACCWSLNPEKMVKELISFGLDGLEIYYPYIRHRKVFKFHSVEKFKKISKKFNLLTTGGTDCHGRDLRVSR